VARDKHPLILACLVLFNVKINGGQNMIKSEGYISVKQGRLFYKKFGSGSTPIIVLHGDPRLGSSYLLPQMAALADKYEVIFYDQRGSGKSQQSDISEKLINADQFVDDLEALRTQLGIKQFILLGHSLGGPLALTYAIKHPKHVSELILLNSTPVSEKGQNAFGEAFNRRIQSIKSADVLLNNLQEFQQLTAEQIAKLYQSIIPLLFYNSLNANKLTVEINSESAKNGDQAIKLMSNSLPPLNHLFTQLKQLTMPTLIIHSEHDAIPLWTAEELKQAIPGSQLVVLAKSDHFPYIETPKQLFSAIDLFLT
jgi:proline iminopeptidase